MKLDRVNNRTLLTSIRRSYSRVWKRMQTEKTVTTNLFVFEYVDCSETEFEHKHLLNICLKVTVVATDEKFITTQRMFFGDDDWTLYRPRGGDSEE